MQGTDLHSVKRARSRYSVLGVPAVWGLRLFLVLAILISSLPALPAAAAPDRGAISYAPTDQESPALPEGTVVTGPEIIPELDKPPAEADALVVDPRNPAWMTLYGSEAARLSLPPRVPASFEAAPEGPAVPLGAWQTHLLQGGTRRITAIVGAPDGRLFAGVTGDGLRVYAPDANGVFAWSAIHDSVGGLASESVTALEVYCGELWVGTQGAGISVLNLSTGAWRQVNVANSPLPHDNVIAIRAFRSPTGSNILWIATSGGAARYTAGAILPWRIVNTGSGLSNNIVLDIAMQFSGSTAYTWFGTADNVDRWDGGSGWTHVSQTGSGSCGMQRATRIVVDHANAVWFAGEVEVPGAAAAPPAEGDESVLVPATHGEESVPEQGYWVPLGVCRRTVGGFGLIF
ncbi:MAG: hypothetical protein IT330_12880, partial [Anaerolineae bacterium]|nr:hypothetical protein [Anaerolineae bacterium]